MDGVSFALRQVKPELRATLERAASQVAGAVERLGSASCEIAAHVEPESTSAIVQRRKLLENVRRDLAAAAGASRILDELAALVQDRHAEIGPPELWEHHATWKCVRWRLRSLYTSETAAMDLLGLVVHLDAPDVALVTGAIHMARTALAGVREEMAALASLPGGERDLTASRLLDEVDASLVGGDLLGVVEERLRARFRSRPARIELRACASFVDIVAALARRAHVRFFDLRHRRVHALMERLVEAQRAWGGEAWILQQAILHEMDEPARRDLDRPHRTHFRPPSGFEWSGLWF